MKSLATAPIEKRSPPLALGSVKRGAARHLAKRRAPGFGIQRLAGGTRRGTMRQYLCYDLQHTAGTAAGPKQRGPSPPPVELIKSPASAAPVLGVKETAAYEKACRRSGMLIVELRPLAEWQLRSKATTLADLGAFRRREPRNEEAKEFLRRRSTRVSPENVCEPEKLQSGEVQLHGDSRRCVGDGGGDAFFGDRCYAKIIHYRTEPIVSAFAHLREWPDDGGGLRSRI